MSERFALRVMQIGAVAVVLAVSTLNAFELDRFFVPKEIVLHVTAVIAGLFALRAIARSGFSRVDLLLVIYLLLSSVSSLLATNRWLALRALTITASSIVIFWTARGLREAGFGRPLINGLALAVVVVAVMSLLQTYGLSLVLFSESRAPGGTLGNRNFVAHIAAIGLPLLFLVTRRLAGFVSIAIVIAALVLTRSRGGWLAFAVVAVIFALALLGSPQLRGDGSTWRRFAGAIVSALVGVGAALVIPNTLHWHGKNPYLESVRRVAEYEQGSGRGRLVQYERSLLMSVRHPLLGVGPGNWAVAYPAHAARGDPSLNDSEPGMTLNPWPSSDWIAFVSERGFAAVALLALAFFGIVAGGIRQLFAAQNRDEAMIAAALLATTAAAIVAGLFDAVLLLGVPALLVWAALGALWIPVAPRPMRAVVVLLVIALSAVGAARSVAQLMAMDIYSTRSDRASLESGSHIDPGNYRLQLRLARIGGKSRCEHARAAHALFPNAAAASRPCGE